MNPKSVEFLRDYNDWRRGEGRHADCPLSTQPETSEIGDAIDWACEQIERMQKRDAQWFEFAMAVGESVGCLASTFPDANNHILRNLPHGETK